MTHGMTVQLPVSVAFGTDAEFDLRVQLESDLTRWRTLMREMHRRRHRHHPSESSLRRHHRSGSGPESDEAGSRGGRAAQSGRHLTRDAIPLGTG